MHIYFLVIMENIGGGMAALLKSAVRPILARPYAGIKNSQKKLVQNVIFSVFFNSKYKLLVVMVSINFFRNFEHFDIWFVFEAVVLY